MVTTFNVKGFSILFLFGIILLLTLDFLYTIVIKKEWDMKFLWFCLASVIVALILARQYIVLDTENLE